MVRQANLGPESWQTGSEECSEKYGATELHDISFWWVNSRISNRLLIAHLNMILRQDPKRPIVPTHEFFYLIEILMPNSRAGLVSVNRKRLLLTVNLTSLIYQFL